MVISLEKFQRYTNVFSDNKELQESYIKSSQDIVENYLGYKLKREIYTSVLNGNGTFELQLRVRPINEILSVKIDGIEKDIVRFFTDNEFIYNMDGLFTLGVRNIVVKYDAGYSVINTNEEEKSEIKTDIPEIIIATILRIAAILQSEADSNIGVTSKSFGDSGTRTFINYTNFDKYLLPISKYKLMAI